MNNSPVKVPIKRRHVVFPLVLQVLALVWLMANGNAEPRKSGLFAAMVATMVVSPIGFIWGLAQFRRDAQQEMEHLASSVVAKPTMRLREHGITLLEYRSIERILARMSPKEIADEDKVSVSAVHNRLSVIYRKLGIPGRDNLLFHLGRCEIEY